MTQPGRARKITILVLTILGGYVLFILPNLFFGITKWDRGLSGINLLYTVLFQFLAVTLLSFVALGRLAN